MNKQEYQEMRDEFATLVYNYEAFLKSGFLTDCRYNVAFFEPLKEIRKCEAEIAVITQAIQAKATHKIEVVLNAIKEAKEKFATEQLQTENKHNYCLQLLSIINKFDKSVFDESEKEFKEFILQYHPVVNLNPSKEAKATYDMLKRFYLECNHLGFKEYLATNIKVFEVPELTEDKYVEASKIYFNFRTTINQQFNDLSKKYPNTKINVFEDEITVQSEKDDLEIKAKKLKEGLVSARKDFYDNFGFELNFLESTEEQK